MCLVAVAVYLGQGVQGFGLAGKWRQLAVVKAIQVDVPIHQSCDLLTCQIPKGDLRHTYVLQRLTLTFQLIQSLEASKQVLGSLSRCVLIK